nr:hypothetical protein [Tanacetum cinerariifolium]
MVVGFWGGDLFGAPATILHSTGIMDFVGGFCERCEPVLPPTRFMLALEIQLLVEAWFVERLTDSGGSFSNHTLADPVSVESNMWHQLRIRLLALLFLRFGSSADLFELAFLLSVACLCRGATSGPSRLLRRLVYLLHVLAWRAHSCFTRDGCPLARLHTLKLFSVDFLRHDRKETTLVLPREGSPAIGLRCKSKYWLNVAPCGVTGIWSLWAFPSVELGPAAYRMVHARGPDDAILTPATALAGVTTPSAGVAQRRWDLFGHDARPRPADKPRPAKKTTSDATASTSESSVSTQFGELMEQELRLKREAAERAFEAQAEKDRTLMRLEELSADVETKKLCYSVTTPSTLK